ncbi:hypothetical protein B7494_g295 [Chlorociboria aeruginascens]|nr:hypothetical protein B7494_g295 [Chlorociboria aeruginascens]
MNSILRPMTIVLVVLCVVANPDTGPRPITITIPAHGATVVNNNAILTGSSNATVTPITTSTKGVTIKHVALNSEVTKIQVTTNVSFIGAQFTVPSDTLFYGVWEYPFSGKLENNGISFNLKGVANNVGINWSNARAPFFITSAGYGVYADTLSMGSFDFSSPTVAQFIFNTSSLTYYIIVPKDNGDYKSIIKEYMGLSAKIEMPPDSAFGPVFWSDDFEEDFHGNVMNAEENYFDVIDHLVAYQIRATDMFADRPYGTGNGSFGNFDFDPEFYPAPKQFIANLSAAGFDFQVWVANRAFLYTQLYNDSVANNWLFPGIDPEQFLGPALNLSIPAAYNYFKTHLQTFPSLGVKGYKIDRGEEGEMPDYEQNVQATLFEQLCYETMVEKWGKGGYYTFSRNVVDRSRAVTGIWNGDSASNFTGLAYSVASGIRAGILGFSMWGSDTGGYTRGANDPTEELWARWMWFSAFSPVYEIMVGTGHTPWYAPYTASLVSVLKHTTNVSTLLLPYKRSYTYQASTDGVSLIRPLWLEFPNDRSAWGSVDQYMFGEQLLVAPVVTEGGVRNVYFPEGAKWLNYFSRSNGSKIYAGGTIVKKLSSTLDEIPVYIREGAIIPIGDLYRGNNEWDSNWKPYLNIEIFPSFDITESKFEYFSRESNRTVGIVMRVSGKHDYGKVVVDVGNFGEVGAFFGTEKSDAIGQVVMYAKGTVRKSPIYKNGGKFSMILYKSIWD